ncbi:MAG: DUF2391 domain-containing protein [Salinirussus sp.]
MTNEPSEDPPELRDLYDELQELEELVESPEARKQVREAMDMTLEVDRGSLFGRVIRGFDLNDAAEMLLGALIFGIPMFVEGGTTEIGQFVAESPAFLVITHLIGIGIAIGILYIADFQDVRIHKPILGLIPRRLVGVLSISFATAAILMTVWGRVDWAVPWIAFCTVSVAYVPMVIGASLGDILPGT